MNSNVRLALCVVAVAICAAIGTTGLVNAQNNSPVSPGSFTFPAQAVGIPSAATPVTVTFSTSATLSSIKVVTQGTTGLDFQQATPAGGTCAVGTTYFFHQTCTVNVVFAPKGVGVRMGAVLLYDNASAPNLLATTFLLGTGNGGLLSFSTTQTTVGGGLNSPLGVAVDAAGNLYIADVNSNRVVEVPASGGPQITVGSGLSHPYGVAVDGAGNVYIADLGNSRVLEVPAGGGTQTTVGTGFNAPSGIAVDGAGNLYITNASSTSAVEVRAGGGAQNSIGNGLFSPVGIAVDGTGNVYIADSLNNRVVEVPAGGGAQTTVGTGLNDPTGVAVDGVGNVYIADRKNTRVIEVPAGGGTQTTVGSGLLDPTGVAVDGVGNVYIANFSSSIVTNVQQTAPHSPLDFGSVTVRAAPKSIGLDFTNIGNVTLTLSSHISGAFYGESDACGGSVPVNGTCTLNLTFTPAFGAAPPGTLNVAGLSISDNAPNSPQSVNLVGFAVEVPTQLVFNTPPFSNVEQGGNAGIVDLYLEDQYNTLVDYASNPVTLTVTGPSGYAQTQSHASLAGHVQFNLSGASLTVPGVYTYTAASAGLISAVATETVLPNAVSVPPQPVGVASSATTVTLAFNTFATLGNIKVVTQGVTGLDFQQATTNGGSCAVNTLYATGQSCTVDVIFKPTGVGQRLGAVLLYDNSSTPNLLASALLSGIGNGGLLAFSSIQTTVGSGLISPWGMAADAAGNVYVADNGNNRLVEVPVGGGSATPIGTGLSKPTGVAVDGAGNIYTISSSSVVRIPVSGGAQTTIGTGLFGPSGVAVDGAGNVYIADPAGRSVVEVQASGSPQVTIGTGFTSPQAVAVDGSNNVYVADNGSGRVVKVPSGCITSACQTVIASGSIYPTGVAVDGAGNVYFSSDNVSGPGVNVPGTVVEVPIGCTSSTCQRVILSGLIAPTGVAVDSLGSIYESSISINSIVKVAQTQLPATQNLGTATVGGTPGTASLSFTNIGNSPLTLTRATAPTQYTESDTCGGSVAVNAACTLNLIFTPTIGSTSPGTVLPGMLTLTDNAVSSPQVINLTATALLTALTPTVQPETEVFGQPFSAGVTLSNTSVGTATGTVTFTAAGKTICTFTGTLASPVTCAAPNSGLAVGTYPVTFNYSGDSHYSAATGSSTLTVTPVPLTFTALPEVAFLSTSSFNTYFSVALTFTGQSGVTPTGTVKFTDPSGKQLCLTSLNTSPPVSNTITCSPATTGLGAGTYTVSFVYSGDSNYAAATGNAVLQVSVPPLGVLTGGSTTVNTTFPVPTAAIGLTVGFSCPTVVPLDLNGVPQARESALLVGITCESSPSSVLLASANTPVTIVISTTPAATAALRPAVSYPVMACLSIPWLGLIGLGSLLGTTRRRRTHWLLLVVVLGVLPLGLASCGGHFTPPAVTVTTGASPTPAGKYNVIVMPTGVPSNANLTAFSQSWLIVPITVVPVSH